MMEKRAVLGKGLSALISENVEEPGAVSQKTVAIVKTTDIDYNSQQPTLHYDEYAF
jgi:hypothetical protein